MARVASKTQGTRRTRGKGKIYATSDEMIAAVSKETGIHEDDVRKVLRATFESTKNYILREVGQLAGEGRPLSDADVEAAATGPYAKASLSTFSLSALSSNALRARVIGSVAP